MRDEVCVDQTARQLSNQEKKKVTRTDIARRSIQTNPDAYTDNQGS